MLDSSAHVGSGDFRQLLRLVSNVTIGWVIGEAKVRVGVMTFSDDPRVEFHLNHYDQGNTLRAAIGALTRTTGTGGTNMGGYFCFVAEFTHTRKTQKLYKKNSKSDKTKASRDFSA